MLFTVPYKIFEQKASPKNVFVNAFNSLYFLLIVIPFLTHFSLSVIREKETGMRRFMMASGLNPVIHFISWLLHYTIINVFVSLLYVMALKVSVFTEDSISLLYFIVFLALQSFFGLIWCLQPFINSSKMAFFTVGFFLLLSQCMAYLVD